MTNKNLTIPEELDFAQLAIDNALSNPVILGYLEEVGYVIDRLKIGRGKLTNALGLFQQHGTEHGEQLNATDAKDLVWTNANKTYMAQLKLARIPIKERGDRDLMKLDGDRKQKWSDWRVQVDAFYTNALKTPRLQQLLLEVNLTVAKLTAAYDQIKVVYAAREIQETESAEAQNMIDERNAALDDLRDWMGDYIAAAHVALEDHPQLLEALGIVVPSKGAARAKSVDTPATPAS